MGMRLRGRAAGCCALALSFCFAGAQATLQAKSPTATSGERVELFAAIAAEQVEVTIVPHKAERVTLQVRNKTDRPLTIEVPPALAAAPVLAQFPGLNNANNNRNNNGNAQANAPQAVGFPGMNNGNNGGNAQQGGNNNPFGMNPGLFNVPSGKVIKVKLPAACLEFGKREPSTRHAYQLQPLATINDHPEIEIILSKIGQQQIRRRVGQLAIWHLANGKSWNDLAALQADRIGGVDLPQYTAEEIQRAKDLVAELAKEKEQSSPAVSISRAAGPG